MPDDQRHTNVSCTSRGSGSPRSIRTQLLVWVNAVLASVLVLFLIIDYRQEFQSRLRDKQVALVEEAQILLPALLRLEHRGHDTVQEFLDDVCGKMLEDQSPGHHIAVQLHGTVFQAMAHHRASTAMFSAMEKAALSKDHQTRLGNESLVVGIAKHGSDTVYVSEYLSNLHRDIRGQILWRICGMAFLGVLAAVVVNVVLMRLVARPVERLAETVRLISQGQLGIQSNGYRTAELSYLANALNEMSRSLDENDRERRFQMAKARRIQDHLLPHHSEIQGLTFAHLYLPASDVGGDYFDLLPMPDGSWLFCIADVTGHGVAAAMEAVILKTLLLEATAKHASVDRVMDFVNDRFAAVCFPEHFASMLVARWKPQTAWLEYASAGHETAYLVNNNGGICELRSTGPLLGIQTGCTWHSATVPLGKGDRLFLVTDGIAETVGPSGSYFGRDKLKGLLAHRPQVPLETVLQELNRVLLGYQGGQVGNDDVTLLAIEF